MKKRLFSVAALLCLGLFTAAGAQVPARRTVKSKSPASAPATKAPAATQKRAAAAAAASTGAKSRAYTRPAPSTTARRSYGRRGYTAASRTATAPASGQSAATAATIAPRSSYAASAYGPSADRYREIQQALFEKGYYKGNVDGTWNAESQEALRRFQSDQNLTSTGKLDSLSLIALGLGPKRDNSAQLTSPATQGINQ